MSPFMASASAEAALPRSARLPDHGTFCEACTIQPPPSVRAEAVGGRNHVAEHGVVERNGLRVALGRRPPGGRSRLDRRVAGLDLRHESLDGQFGLVVARIAGVAAVSGPGRNGRRLGRRRTPSEQASGPAPRRVSV